MRLSPAIFGYRLPSGWLPFGLCACAVVCTYAGTGGGVQAIGPAGLVGTLTITLFGALHYELYRAVILAHRQAAETQPHTPQPEPEPVPVPAPVPAGWTPRVFAAEAAWRRDLVSPAIPEWAAIEDARRLAVGIVRGQPLTHRQWSPIPYPRETRERLWLWMRQNNLTERIGNTHQVRASQAGIAWARDMLRTYPTPLVRKAGKK